MPRKIYSLMVWLKSAKRIGAIVTPPDNPGGCLRLINSKRNWLTATAGDAVLLIVGDSTERYFIECIELYLVDPSSDNGRVVTTAGEWLNGGNDA